MRLVIALLLILTLYACSIPPPLLEKIKQQGELVVATRYSLTTYYEERNGFAGIEHDLVKAFAEHLGVRVRFEVPDRVEQIIPMVIEKKAHMAAAGLSITRQRRSSIRFSSAYHESVAQLVYRSGSRKPRNAGDLKEEILEIIKGGGHEERLIELKEKYPSLKWNSQTDMDEEELLYLLHEELIDYAIADSDQVVLSRRFYPELNVAFNLGEMQPLAWAFHHSQDTSLFDEAQKFLAEAKDNGLIADLIERYYGHTKRLNYVDKRAFKRRILTRLPEYRPLFEKAAEQTGLDWKLIAAVGYQESHWNPKAVSPTGVKGIMMLTQATTKFLGLTDRTDPWQSIIGGARYIVKQEKRIPQRIQQPDRLWFALAGYNVGFGHLEDARILTQRQNGNADRWREVKLRLPLLSNPKYYKTLKYGRARGREPLIYVDNVRAYFDLLSWHIKEEEGTPEKIDDYPMTVFPPTL